MRKSQLIRYRLLLAFILLASDAVIPHDALYNDHSIKNVFSNQHLISDYEIEIKKIVIDPGHGGKDPGCKGTKFLEKDIALQISLKLEHLLKLYHPDIEVILTRSDDRFVPLHQRIDIARQSNADLFISIHCNGFKNANIHGTETFVMGLHTVEENLEVAKRENAAIMMEDDFDKNYDGYDPNSPIGHILLSSFQNSNLNNSLEIAGYIENNFAKRSKKISRGVKQAGFVVLRQATMPSILVETGFLSNQEEEQYLGSIEGQSEIAQNLAHSLGMYINDKKSLSDQNEHNISHEPPLREKLSKAELGTTVYTIATKASIVNESRKIKAAKLTSSKIGNKKPTNYSVQIAASIGKPMKQSDQKWQSLKNIEIVQLDGFYKYYHGSFTDMQDASTHKMNLQKTGFKGAFIVKR